MDLSCITLRPFRLSDSEALLLYFGNDQSMRDGDDAFKFIQDIFIPHPWLRSICIHDYSVGFVSIYPGSDNDDRCRADIGYIVAEEYWGQGIATRAVKMAVRQVFAEFPDVVRVQGFVEVDDMASQRVLEKAGFVREGVMRRYAYMKGNIEDIIVFSFLSTDV